MAHLSIPPEMYTRTGHLLRAFEEVAPNVGDSTCDATRLFKMLPIELRNAPAFVDALEGMWRYEYGEAFNRLPNDVEVIGADQCPEAQTLYCAIKFMDAQLQPQDIIAFMNRLGDVSQHADALAELFPLTRLKGAFRVAFEPPDQGEGNRKIDWLIKPGDSGPPILLEVKDRRRDLISLFRNSIPSMTAGGTTTVPPSLDVTRLFLDTSEKFRPADPAKILQGAWIFCPIKQIRSEVEDHFNHLDKERFHFALLANWDGEATGLWRSEETHSRIAELFDISESDCFYHGETSAT